LDPLIENSILAHGIEPSTIRLSGARSTTPGYSGGMAAESLKEFEINIIAI
jgi:hypothetical protein